jgi:hypothetical protein
MAKHDWNSLQHYLEIHDKTIRFYQQWMETPRFYTHEILNEYFHALNCIKIFVHTYKGTRVRVDIKKDVEIDPSTPKRLRARTFKYSYSANIPGGLPLIRYCSPHDDFEEEGSAPHHAYHHRHDFTKNPKGEVIVLGNDEWPHVGEFFEEVLSTL